MIRSNSKAPALEGQGSTLQEIVTKHFEELRDGVYRYVITAFGGDTSSVEDITQEVFLQLYGRLRAGHSINNVRGWVFEAAHSLAINRLRRQQYVQLLDDEGWKKIRLTLLDAAPNPEEKLSKLERYNRIRIAMAGLNETERQCLRLRIEGLKYREISEILKIGTTTVSATLCRVIDKLGQDNTR